MTGEGVEKRKRSVNPMFALGADAKRAEVSSDGDTDRKRESPGSGSASGSGSDVKPAGSGEFTPRQVNPMFLPTESQGGFGSAPPLPQLGRRPAGAGPVRSDESVGTGRVLRPNPSIHLTPPEEPARRVKRKSFGEVKPDALTTAEDWEGDSDVVPEFGLGAEGGSDVKPQFEKALSLTKRDHVFLRFLARYRYANADQLGRLTDSQPKRVNVRLNQLAQRGFVRKEIITRGYHVWVATAAGNQVAGVDMPPIRRGTLSYVTLAHTMGLTNLGVEFERDGGGVDLLGERKGEEESIAVAARRYVSGEWGMGEPLIGEHVVTERMIRQSQKTWRGHDVATMRELVRAAVNAGEPGGAGAEMDEGQESLFIVYGSGGKSGEHVPDMVLVRPRGEDGKPEHIAIELELSAKEPSEWTRVLRAYRDNGDMYSKVYYFTHKPAIHRGLVRVAKSEPGLADKLRVRKYIPMNNRVPFWG